MYTMRSYLMPNYSVSTVLMWSGEKILFLDLTADPYLFKGPKGDKQVRNLTKLSVISTDMQIVYLLKLLQCHIAVGNLQKDEDSY